MLSEKQQAMRMGGLGGSEIAAVCGIYPFAAPIDVWMSKRGLKPPIDEWTQAPLVRGALFEEPVKRWYSLKTGRHIAPCPTMVSPRNPLVIATPDGISYDPANPADRCPLEVKNPSWRMGHHWGEEWTDEIPDYYMPQVIWEMEVTGLRLAHVCAYMGDEPRIYAVHWSEELYGSLVEIAEQFWVDHVLAGVPPPVDGTDSYKRWIEERYPRALKKQYRQIDDTIRPWVDRLLAARAQVAETEAEIALCQNVIKEWIGDHDGLVCEQGRIDWKNNKDKVRVDYKAVVQSIGANEDVLRQHTTVSPGARPFFVRFKGDKAS